MLDEREDIAANSRYFRVNRVFACRLLSFKTILSRSVKCFLSFRRCFAANQRNYIDNARDATKSAQHCAFPTRSCAFFQVSCGIATKNQLPPQGGIGAVNARARAPSLTNRVGEVRDFKMQLFRARERHKRRHYTRNVCPSVCNVRPRTCAGEAFARARDAECAKSSSIVRCIPLTTHAPDFS